MRTAVIALLSVLLAAAAAGGAFVILNNDGSDHQTAPGEVTVDPAVPETEIDPEMEPEVPETEPEVPGTDPETEPEVPGTDPGEPETDPGEPETDPEVPEDTDDGARDAEQLVGKYLQFEFSGSTQSNDFMRRTTNITGEVTYTYLLYKQDRGAFYMMSETQVLTTRGTQILDFDEYTNFYWTDEDDHESTYTYGEETTLAWGDGTVAVIPLTIRYSSGSSTVTEVQYCGIGEDWWVVYRIEYTSVSSGFGSSSTQVVYTLREYGDADLSPLVDLCIYTDAGITVDIEGTVAVGGTVTLTASGDGFGGWFDMDGELLSQSAAYSFDVAVGTVSIVARNVYDDDLYAQDWDVPVILTADADSGTWSIGTFTYDLGTELVLDPGGYVAYFTGEKDGKPVYLYRNIKVDGDHVVRTYVWTYKGTEYALSLDIAISDYDSFADALDFSERCDTWYETRSTAADLAFVNTVSTADDPYLERIAAYFTARTAGMSAQEAADVVLSFVQDAIRYVYDEDSHGSEEYWQYPLETLFLGTGDCEDTSILFAAICKEMGWDAALFLLSGHMAAGIVLDDFADETPGYSGYLSSDNGYACDGRMYYYCETTGESSSYHVGDVPACQTLYTVMPVGTA